MDQLLFGLARAVAITFDLPEPIVEIGSYQVAGQESIGDLRTQWPGKTYVGLDMRAGSGVDVVANVEHLGLADASVGTVVAMSVFEHVRRFWQGLDEVHRVLRPDGALVLACPFHFRVHAFPNDYWRFTRDALDVLLERYPSRIVGYHGSARRPVHVWAVAFREQRPPITQAQYTRFREAVGRHARQPLRPFTRLRYRLGRLLCGARPFEPFLLRDRWDCDLVNPD